PPHRRLPQPRRRRLPPTPRPRLTPTSHLLSVRRLLPPLLTGLLLLAAWHALHLALPPEQRFLLPTLGRILAAATERAPQLLTATGWTALAALGGLAL